jgi:STAS domain
MSFDPTGFAISTSEQGGRTVVSLRGELDLATAPQLEQVVTERLAAGDEVVLDLRELAFMDSCTRTPASPTSGASSSCGRRPAARSPRSSR